MRTDAEIKSRIKELFNMKLEDCICTSRKDKMGGCDHCMNCMGYDDCIEELKWVLQAPASAEPVNENGG